MRETLLVIAGLVLALIAVVFVIEIPEMKRYAKMKRM